jgi:hypothetical protein
MRQGGLQVSPGTSRLISFSLPSGIFVASERCTLADNFRRSNRVGTVCESQPL